MANVDVGQILLIVEKLKPLIELLGGLFRRDKPTPIPPSAPAPVVVNAPTPIVPPPASVPDTGEQGRRVARVRLKVAMAEYSDAPGHMYPDAMGLVNSGSNFNFGSHLWLDSTAFDDESEEWQGHSIIAADLDYRTELQIFQNGSLVAFIRGRGGKPGEPDPWEQQTGAGVHFGFRAWKDSLGFNCRTTFDNEGMFDAVSYVNGIESNHIRINVS